MDILTLDSSHEDKPDFDNVNTICRCCFATDKRVYNSNLFAEELSELAGIDFTSSDSLPKWLCTECARLLKKAVWFKRKLLKSHILLYEYSERCAPFPIDATDPELTKYSSPILALTKVLSFDNGAKAKSGFHPVLEHTKVKHDSISELDIPSLNDDLLAKPECFDDDSMVFGDDDLTVKEESVMVDDDDDDRPLGEFRSNKLHNLTDDDLALLLPVEKKEDQAKTSKKKKIKTEKQKDVSKERSSIRKQIEIDPKKIRLINLDPEEQTRQRELESKQDGYLKLPYKCGLCYKGFNFENKLVNHMGKHKPSRGKFECEFCHMFLPTQYSFSVHMRIHTIRYECLVCGRRMIDKMSIIEHYRSQHEGITTQYKCHLCGKISSNSKTHRGHMRNHHSGARPHCHVCGNTFVNADSLTEHLQIHEGVKNHECPDCLKKFRTKTQLKSHLLTHSDNRDYYCVECDVRFKSSTTLKQHLMRSLKHKDVDSFQYTCPHCPRRYESLPELKTHQSIQHDGQRLHKCDVCGAGLASRAGLVRHMARHEQRPRAKQRMFVCHACGKGFTSSAVLSNHVRTHTGERPFACGDCGRRFTQKASANTHWVLIHKGEKRNRNKQKEFKTEPETCQQPSIYFDEVADDKLI